MNATEGVLNYFNGLLFTDSLIDGTACEVVMSIPMLIDTAEHPLKREYKLVLQSLSHDAYSYRRSVMATRSLSQMFSEPQQVYSNLSSKVGIFAAIARREIEIIFNGESVSDAPHRR